MRKSGIFVAQFVRAFNFFSLVNDQFVFSSFKWMSLALEPMIMMLATFATINTRINTLHNIPLNAFHHVDCVCLFKDRLNSVFLQKSHNAGVFERESVCVCVSSVRCLCEVYFDCWL